jgi:Glutamyl-tRNAGlu reductase, dimerisation domain
VQVELKRSQYRLRTLTLVQNQEVQIHLRGIANKLLHPAMRTLKQAAQQGNVEAIERICALFGVAALPLLQAKDNESDRQCSGSGRFDDHVGKATFGRTAMRKASGWHIRKCGARNS